MSGHAMYVLLVREGPEVAVAVEISTSIMAAFDPGRRGPLTSRPYGVLRCCILPRALDGSCCCYRRSPFLLARELRYLRVKRRNQTFCFVCEDTDTVLDVKRKVFAAVSQHSEDGPDNDNDGPSSAESLQLLIPAGPKQPQQEDEDDNVDEDDDDEEMMEDGNDTNIEKRRRRSSFLKDDDTLGSVRGKAAAAAPSGGKEAAEEAELLLHVVFPVADNEWEPVDVAPTIIQDS
jgi:hypothetical protein